MSLFLLELKEADLYGRHILTMGLIGRGHGQGLDETKTEYHMELEKTR